jgi:hypothetical protein
LWLNGITYHSTRCTNLHLIPIDHARLLALPWLLEKTWVCEICVIYPKC